MKAEVETIKGTEVEEGGGAIPLNLCDHNFMQFSLDHDPMDGSVDGRPVGGQWLVGWLVGCSVSWLVGELVGGQSVGLWLV